MTITENDPYTKRLGKRIRAERYRMKLSQADFAKRAGITRGYLSDIERGARIMSIDTLARLCLVFCLSADRLLEVRGGR